MKTHSYYISVYKDNRVTWKFGQYLDFHRRTQNTEDEHGYITYKIVNGYSRNHDGNTSNKASDEAT